MLHFLRKHQKYFFFVITIVVIASFSFFGTYDTLAGNAIHEQVVFTALDGTKVTRADLDAMVAFLTTDNDDKRLFGGAWGPNFLNDGVIKNDILTTGIGEILATTYPELVGRDLAPRLEKEKRYNLYAHPQAKFISVESAWEYFAPGMKANYRILRRSENPVEQKAFAARIALYLNERQFSAPLLRQVLRYQQQQQGWVTPDPSLEHIDLSLFGYHTIDDWFGPRFVRIIAEFIMNSATLAEQKGYEVSKSEALADLMKNSEISFQQNLNNHHLGVANSTEYMNEQLRLLGMDRTKAVKVWKQVLLFRRLFQDVGNSVVTDALSHNLFNTFAKETVTGDLYRLPHDLRLQNYRGLQKFETYLYSVAKRPRLDKMNDAELLAIPSEFLAVDEVKRKYPEFVQKHYVLEIAQANKSALQSKISLKETWNWEADDKNWEILKKEFPELAIKKAPSRKDKIEALDSLDDMTRAKVDSFARNAIVDEHPEWIDEALKDAEHKKIALGLTQKGGNSIFVGFDNREDLINLIDKAPLNEEPKDKLARISGDDIHYFNIKVIERSPKEEILTFAEANHSGVLDQLLDQSLEAQYPKIRDANAKDFKKEDGTWKPFAEVKDKVADHYYEKLLKAIQNDAKEEKTLTGDKSASLRFYAYMKDIQKKLKRGEDASQLIKSADAKKSVNNQWQIEKINYKTERSSDDRDIDTTEMFAINSNEWTDVHTPVNGDLYFFQLANRGDSSEDLTASYDAVHEAHAIISDDAQRNYTYAVVKKLKDSNAISLDYLNAGEETIEPEEESKK